MDNGRPPIRNVHLTRAICLVQLPRTCGPPGRGRGSSSYPSSDRTTPFNSSPSSSSVKLGADALSLHLLSGPVYRRELAKVSCLSAVTRQRDAVLDEISGFAGSWISWRSVGAGCRLTRDWTSDLTDNENWWHFCLIVTAWSDRFICDQALDSLVFFDFEERFLSAVLVFFLLFFFSREIGLSTLVLRRRNSREWIYGKLELWKMEWCLMHPRG